MTKSFAGPAPEAWHDTAICFALAFAYLLLRAPLVTGMAAGIDHNYQLSMGVAILHGRLPGIDFHVIYGPFVAFTSALAYGLGGYAGEAVLCAAGYAAAIALSASVLLKTGRRISGYLCALLLLLVLSRFYKWYYWFFQVLPLAFFIWRLQGNATWRSLALWGGSAGLALLFRMDLGALGLVFGLLSLALWDRHVSDLASYCRQAGWFVAGFLAVVLLWSGFIMALGGAGNLIDFFSAFFIGTSQMLDAQRILPFQFMPTEPFSRANLLATLQVALLLVYGFGLWLGWQARRGQANSLQGQTIGAVALVGLGVYPQALHRADAAHMLQVVPPVLILLFLYFDRSQRWRSAASAAVLALLVHIGWPVASGDLSPLLSNKRVLWSGLYRFPQSAASVPFIDAGLAAGRASGPDDGIFVAHNNFAGPVFVAANRRFAGNMPSYFPGLGSDAYWEQKIRASLQADPPKVIVANRALWFDPAKATSLAPYYPDVLADWRRRYTMVLHENAQFIVLGLPN
jgi:hypothetical protein